MKNVDLSSSEKNDNEEIESEIDTDEYRVRILTKNLMNLEPLQEKINDVQKWNDLYQNK